MQPGGTIDARELLHHGDWIRGLARSLVRDPNEADDLAQEAWLAAMKHGPRHGENVRGWFATVMHNALRMRRRSATRRVSRESASGERDALPSTAELVAEASLHERLVQLVLALDEPERSALLLHFFKNLSLSEIARRQGLPVSTVHARVQRGVSRLRRRLDHSFGAGAWFATVSRLAETPTPLGWIGRRLASTQGKIVVGTAIVLAVWLGARIWITSVAERNAASTATTLAPASSPSIVGLRPDETLALPQAPSIADTARAPVARGELPAESAPRVVRREETPHGVHGRLIDETRTPVGYGVVGAWQRGKRIASVDVGTDGTYELGTLDPGVYELRVDSVPSGYLPPYAQEGFARPFESAHEPRFFSTEIQVVDSARELDVDLAVFRAARINGFIGREDWTELAGIRVRLQSTRAGLDFMAFETKSDATGAFRFDDVYPGSYRIEVLMDRDQFLPDAAVPAPLAVEIAGGERESVDLLFRAHPTEIIGGVAFGWRSNVDLYVCATVDLDRATNGKPFTLENRLQFVKVDDDGRFSMRGLPPEPVTLFAFVDSAADDHDWRPIVWSDPQTIRLEITGRPVAVGVLEIRSGRPRSFHGRVRWESSSVRFGDAAYQKALHAASIDWGSKVSGRKSGSTLRVSADGEFDVETERAFHVLSVFAGRRPPSCVWVNFDRLPKSGLDVLVR
ncbi:MAG: sigma-70 family RNA polymerase sigma factor [Planctomycetes bacterium]|nr:sigma-70 family RNA polymerase sigma factor [Planctomycetota bacterium]